MANATSTLVVKTEGIADAYKDISKILGPLQATNELIIQLNKTLQAVNEAVNRHSNVLDKLFPKGKAIIEVVGNIKAEINETTTSTTRMEKQLTLITAMKVFDFLKEGFQTAKRFAGQLTQATFDATQNFNQWETSAKVLMQSLKSFPTTATFKGLTEWGSSVQFDMGVTSTELNNLLSYSVQLGKTEDEIKQVTEAVMDFSAATGREAKDAVKAIGSALTGNIDALRRVNIYISEAEKRVIKYGTAQQKLTTVLNIFQSRYKNAAREMAQTSAGQLKTFQAIKEEVERIFGLVMEPAFYGTLRAFNDVLKDIYGELNERIFGVVNGIYDASKTQKTVLESVSDILVFIGTTFTTLYTNVFNGVQSIVSLTKDIVAGLKSVFNALGSTEKAAGGLGHKFRVAFAVLGPSLKYAVEIFSDFMLVLAAVGGNVVTWVQQTWYKVQKFLLEKFSDFKKIILEEVSGVLGDIAEALPKGKLSAWFDESARNLFQEAREAAEENKDEIDDLQTGIDNLEKDYTNLGDLIETTVTRQTKEWKKAIQEAERELVKGDMAARKFAEDAYKYGQQRIEQMAQFAKRPVVPQVDTSGIEGAVDKTKEETKKAMKELIDYNKQCLSLLRSLMETVGSTIGEVLEHVRDETYDTRKAWYEMLQALAKNIYEWGISTLITNAIAAMSAATNQQVSGPVGAIPFVGPAIAAGLGAALMAGLAANKSKIEVADIKYANGGYVSNGLVRGGVYGRDSVSAMLAPGERVLSAREAERYDQTGGSPSPVINLTLNVSGGLSSPDQIQNTVRNTLIPALRNAVKQGYAIT